MENVHSIFVNIQKIYNQTLRVSINAAVNNGCLEKVNNPLNYNYLLVDGTLLYQLLDLYESLSLSNSIVKNKHFEWFKEIIFYAGKGINNRKMTHLTNGKKICLKKLPLDKVCAKFSKVAQIWEKGHGIAVLQLFPESSHYETMSREFAIIKAIGLNNLTNVINSAPFGAMKCDWNPNEIINYGNMILYNTLCMAISERPILLYQEDIILAERNQAEDNYELRGILECFLELNCV